MIVLTSSTGVAAHKCNESPVGFCLWISYGRRRWSCELEDNLRLIPLGKFDEERIRLV
jgi:hypothetical protein